MTQRFGNGMPSNEQPRQVSNWWCRTDARHIDASLPDWFISYHDDLTDKLPSLSMPTLLIWGDADPISPVAVGERLAAALPHAKLHVIPGGDHGVASTFADVVAPLIDRHLATT